MLLNRREKTLLATAHPGFQDARKIRALIQKEFGRDDLRVHDRHPSTHRVRCLAMWLCRVLTDLSYPEIGREFKRDHASVWNAVDKVNQRRNIDAAYRDVTDELALGMAAKLESRTTLDRRFFNVA